MEVKVQVHDSCRMVLEGYQKVASFAEGTKLDILETALPLCNGF